MSVEIGGLRVGVTAIIPAAGSGARMKGASAKQFLPLQGEPVLVHTVRLFSESPLVDEVIIAANDMEETTKMVGVFPKVSRIVKGGADRQGSVWAALREIGSRPRVVCVHDAARPLLPKNVLMGVLSRSAVHQAQVVAVPVKDTVKVVGDDGYVSSTPDRSTLWNVQTPQVFWIEVLMQAFQRAILDGFVGTDCASLVERLSMPVHVHPGSPENIKLTTPEDLLLAELVLARRNKEASTV